ncbi:AAA family ATPase [Micromonospora sp. SD12]|uniref:AAA family ATPase n=1 Tax=Micromonospora sp. SD12 TaxID=3452216 RepID=UPI003F8A6F8B
MLALSGHENAPSAQDVIEGRLIQIGLRALDAGTNVVIDFGLRSRDERSALRQAAAELDTTVHLRYFKLPLLNSADDSISVKPTLHTRRGPCSTKNDEVSRAD